VKIIDNKKVYIWSVGVCIVAVLSFFLGYFSYFQAFITIALFGGIAFVRHTVSKMQDEIKDMKTELKKPTKVELPPVEVKVNENKGVSRFI
jgi:hypothetical protein